MPSVPESFRSAYVFLAMFCLCLGLSACSGKGSATSQGHLPGIRDPGAVACAVNGAEDGIRFGVNLDWERDSVAEYSKRLGKTPAVFVVFAAYPMDEVARQYVKDIASQLAQSRSSLMLTLEPHHGLASITRESAQGLAEYLSEINALGTPLYLRFAHEMNGPGMPGLRIRRNTSLRLRSSHRLCMIGRQEPRWSGLLITVAVIPSPGANTRRFQARWRTKCSIRTRTEHFPPWTILTVRTIRAMTSGLGGHVSLSLGLRIPLGRK